MSIEDIKNLKLNLDIEQGKVGDRIDVLIQFVSKARERIILSNIAQIVRYNN